LSREKRLFLLPEQGEDDDSDDGDGDGTDLAKFAEDFGRTDCP
jgi:hypothetical protein